VRTDRHLCFKEYKPNLEKVNNILLTYCWNNWNIGYTQGMNDMVVPLLTLYNDEVDTYWCFKGLMEKVKGNFCRTQIGIYTQLFKLSKLIKLMDPLFHSYLTNIEAGHVLFCFKCLLLYFKREFELDEVMQLWDVFWCNYFEDFQLFFAFAVLLQHREEIFKNKMDSDDLLLLFRMTNNLTKNMDMNSLLNLGISLCLRFEEMATPEIKDKIFREALLTEDVIVTPDNGMYKVLPPKILTEKLVSTQN